MSNSSGGFGVGSVIAGIISWVHWHSVGWCIFHVICGWLYVIYFLLVYGCGSGS
jgi:hypothetical protein